jgi:hypothetical protein
MLSAFVDNCITKIFVTHTLPDRPVMGSYSIGCRRMLSLPSQQRWCYHHLAVRSERTSTANKGTPPFGVDPLVDSVNG